MLHSTYFFDAPYISTVIILNVIVYTVKMSSLAGMTFLLSITITTLISLGFSHIVQRKLYINFEPVSNEEDSRSIARDAIVSFHKRSDEGRELTQCRMLNSLRRNDIAKEGINFPEHMVKRISKNEMDDLERRCSESSQEEHISYTYPGTKWCGPYSLARNYLDIGPLEADKCCRAQYYCDYIPGRSYKYELQNTSPYPLINCDCEKTFDYCLKDIFNKRTDTGAQHTRYIRALYFKFYNPKCFRLYCRDEKSDRSDTCINEYAVVKMNYQKP